MKLVALEQEAEVTIAGETFSEVSEVGHVSRPASPDRVRPAPLAVRPAVLRSK